MGVNCQQMGPNGLPGDVLEVPGALWDDQQPPVRLVWFSPGDRAGVPGDVNSFFPSQ